MYMMTWITLKANIVNLWRFLRWANTLWINVITSTFDLNNELMCVSWSYKIGSITSWTLCNLLPIGLIVSRPIAIYMGRNFSARGSLLYTICRPSFLWKGLYVTHGDYAVADLNVRHRRHLVDTDDSDGTIQMYYKVIGGILPST